MARGLWAPVVDVSLQALLCTGGHAVLCSVVHCRGKKKATDDAYSPVVSQCCVDRDELPTLCSVDVVLNLLMERDVDACSPLACSHTW